MELFVECFDFNVQYIGVVNASFGIFYSYWLNYKKKMPNLFTFDWFL
jgi:hypothetical protein